MKRALFIYNPNSGNRKIPTELDSIVSQFFLKDILIVPLRFTIETAPKMITLMKDKNIDFIIGAGGDGTIGSIARKMVINNINKPYGVMGVGTCNNFATNIGMSKSIPEMIDIISKFNIEKVDVGMLNNNNLFLSSLAVGIFAQTSYETDSSLKEWIGPLAYYLNAITQLRNIKANEFKIICDGEIINKRAYLAIIANGTNLGSFTNLFENKVDLQDGLMEMMIVKESSPVEVANLLLKVVKGEDFTKSPLIEIYKGKKIKIESNANLAVSVDGEKGPRLPLDIEVKSDKIQVIVKTI